MPDRLDPDILRREFEHIRVGYPDVWADPEARAITLDTETSIGLTEALIILVRDIRRTEGEILGAESEIKDIKARCTRYERRIEGLRAMAFNFMQWAEMRKVETPRSTLSIRAGTQKVMITDTDPTLAFLPPDCIRTKREPNLVEIGKRLKSGETINGCELSNAAEVLHMTKT